MSFALSVVSIAKNQENEKLGSSNCGIYPFFHIDKYLCIGYDVIYR